MKTGFYRKMARKNTRGSTPIVVVCSTLFVIMISAMLTDVGYYAAERFKLTKDVEAVVSYGAEELAKGSNNAEYLISNYAREKIDSLSKIEIRIPDNRGEITVVIRKHFSYNFLKFAGFSEKDIVSSSTARLSVVRSLKGIRPFAVQKQKLIYRKLYTLSYGTDKGGMTAFLPIDLGNGDYKVDIVYGSRKKVSVGDKITALKDPDGADIESGIKTLLGRCKHVPACTYTNYIKDCSRIIALPVVDKLQPGEATMKIVGFTAFFVEDITDVKGHTLIKGRFIKHAVKADTTDSINNYGLTGIKMLN